MKNKYKYEIMEIADDLMAVPINDDASDFRGVIKANGITADIIRLLENEISEEGIIAELQKEYDATKEQITESVHKVLDTLRTEGLLIE